MTEVKFVSDLAKDIVIKDNWARAIGTSDLPDKLTGTTTFDDLPDEDVKDADAREEGDDHEKMRWPFKKPMALKEGDGPEGRGWPCRRRWP